MGGLADSTEASDQDPEVAEAALVEKSLDLVLGPVDLGELPAPETRTRPFGSMSLTLRANRSLPTVPNFTRMKPKFTRMKEHDPATTIEAALNPAHPALAGRPRKPQTGKHRE